MVITAPSLLHPEITAHFSTSSREQRDNYLSVVELHHVDAAKYNIQNND